MKHTASLRSQTYKNKVEAHKYSGSELLSLAVRGILASGFMQVRPIRGHANDIGCLLNAKSIVCRCGYYLEIILEQK